MPNLEIFYESSDRMAADIYTKAFANAVKWQAAIDLINLFPKLKRTKCKFQYITEDTLLKQCAQARDTPTI